MSVCLFGTAACFLCIPVAMERGGIVLTSTLLGILGLLQGPMSPCQAQVNRDWIPPEGQERSNVLRIQGLAHTSSPMLAAIVTPFLAKAGWRRIFHVLGGTVGVFSVMWHVLVSNRRGGDDTATETSTTPKPPPAVVGSPARRGNGADSQKRKLPDANAAASPEWKIFTLPSVIALIYWQFGSNFLFAVLQMLGPTYYTATLGCSSERTGILLALAQLANFPASFLGVPDKRYAVAAVPAHLQRIARVEINC
jgi:MFS family permease